MKLSTLIILIVLTSINVAYGSDTLGNNRPAHWAAPVSMNGVPNLHKVSDTLYRSAQPTAEGMANLKAHGIKSSTFVHSTRTEKR